MLAAIPRGRWHSTQEHSNDLLKSSTRASSGSCCGHSGSSGEEDKEQKKKKKKKKKKKQTLTAVSTRIRCSATKASSNNQARSSSTIARRESESSSILSSCISAVSSLISDKESKRIVVLDAIQHICTVSNDNQQDNILQDIHRALEGENSKLEAVILSSGSGSYSFIVFVENRPDLCLYAELTFGDDTEQRAENEWANMRSHYSTPLGCWDVVEEADTGSVMKLLVAEWSNKKTHRSEMKKHGRLRTGSL